MSTEYVGGRKEFPPMSPSNKAKHRQTVNSHRTGRIRFARSVQCSLHNVVETLIRHIPRQQQLRRAYVIQR